MGRGLILIIVFNSKSAKKKRCDVIQNILGPPQKKYPFRRIIIMAVSSHCDRMGVVRKEGKN